MPTRKKAASPDFYWVDYWKELSILVPSTEADHDGFRRLFLGREDLELLDLNEFCEGTQPVYIQPSAGDFLSGAWRQKYKDAVLKKIYYDHAEEY